jgi:hypothetical protein
MLDSRLADDFNQMSHEEKEMVKQAIFNSLQNAVAEILTDMAP